MLDLKVGDEVVVVRYWRGLVVHARVNRVAKMTATQATIENGCRFSLKSGREIGDTDWGAVRIEPATPKLMAEFAEILAKTDALEKCKRASEYLSRVTDDDAVRVAAMIPEEWME